MQKTIYEGRSRGIFEEGTFYSFMANFQGADFVTCGKKGSDNEFAFHVSPQGISVRYVGNPMDAQVTLFGNEPQMSEIERIILEEAQKR